MPKRNDRVLVHVKTAINSASIRRERRHGRDVIVVPSATMPDDVIMNGIQYPAEEIAKAFMTLDGTPAPLGHPSIGGMFVSASDPRGLVRGFVGAWNENVRRTDGRVLLDKIVDVEYAGQSTGGKTVLSAIEKGEPVHTSTGLYANLVKSDSADAEFIATDIEFDHDAILIGEDGAATPGQGVGMLVNKAVDADGKEIQVVNSALDEAMSTLDWAAELSARAADQLERAPLIERIKAAILDVIRGEGREPETTVEADMPVNDEQFQTLSEKVGTLSDGMDKIGETIANAVKEAVAPLMEETQRVAAENQARDEAELADLRTKIVKANLLDEEAAKDLTLNTARALADRAKPGKAAAINGAGAGGSDNSGGFKLPNAEA